MQDRFTLVEAVEDKRVRSPKGRVGLINHDRSHKEDAEARH